MKRLFISLILVSLVVAVSAIGNFYQTNYHKTAEAAFEELTQTSDAAVFPLDDNRLALLLNKDGTISIAHMNVERLFDIYEDFDIYPTELTVFEDSLADSIPYVTNPEMFTDYSFGLIKDERATYTTMSINPPGEERKVIPLREFIDDPDLKDISLWSVPISLPTEELAEVLVFLDREKKPLSIDAKELSLYKISNVSPK